MKRILINCLLAASALTASAQSGTNSPYSQYGLGILSDQSQGFNRGMNGLALGMRGNHVNAMNPASYSAVDSLTMLFDLGMSGQVTNFKENGASINAYNADFEYAVAAFRLMPGLGFSAGVLPYTNIGYNYNDRKVINSTMTSVETYSGSGGLHQAYVGVGWSVLKSLSVGANLSYLWGTYDKKITVVNSDSYVNSVIKNYTTSVNSYKLDLGVQWQQQIDKNNLLTVGVTYGLGHDLGADAQSMISNTNSQTAVSTTDTMSVSDALSIPTTFGVGFALKHKDNLTFGVDYTLQKWGGVDFPETNPQTGAYELKSGLLKDRSKITVGAEWLPNAEGRFLQKVRYRAGASYATPYITVNGADGPKEYSASIGFGLPITTYKNRQSMFNFSAQWVHSSASNMITENTFRINLGITFNENWFAKWKVE